MKSPALSVPGSLGGRLKRRNSCALYMLLDFGRPFPLEGVRFGTRAGRDDPLCDLLPFLSSADFEDLTDPPRALSRFGDRTSPGFGCGGCMLSFCCVG